MRNMRKLYLGITFMLVFLIGTIYVIQNNKLITGKADNIVKIKIGDNEYTEKEDIITIYSIIKKTRTKSNWFPNHLEEQSGDPLYDIDITYSNGRVKSLLTSPNGRYIFKYLPTQNGYIGGFNKEIYKIYKEGFISK